MDVDPIGRERLVERLVEIPADMVRANVEECRDHRAIPVDVARITQWQVMHCRVGRGQRADEPAGSVAAIAEHPWSTASLVTSVTCCAERIAARGSGGRPDEGQVL